MAEFTEMVTAYVAERPFGLILRQELLQPIPSPVATASAATSRLL